MAFAAPLHLILHALQGGICEGFGQTPPPESPARAIHDSLEALIGSLAANFSPEMRDSD